MDEWFYAEEGKSVGPVSAAVVARVVAGAGDRVPLVWSPGMAEWVDGRTLPQFAARAAKPADRAEGLPGKTPPEAREKAPGGHWRRKLLERARHELISYLAVSAYLMVWFLAVMFYKSTVLRGAGVDFAPFGVAAVVKALILGKFIVTLEVVRLGERRGRNAMLIVQIVKKALLFTVALVVMSIAEEIVVGYLHGRNPKEALSEIAGGSLPQVLATAFLMFLVLLPYLAFRRLALEIGELPELLFARPGVGKQP